MVAWSAFLAAAPEFAGAVQDRMAAGRYVLLGTIRSDGFPRISGVVPHFADDELLLLMRRDSAMADDLRREPRCSLHSGPVDSGYVAFDAKVQAVADEVEHPERIDALLTSLGASSTSAMFTAFTLQPVDSSTIRLSEDHRHIVDTWRQGETGTTTRVR